MAYNEKQIQIIETAEKLFAAKGYDATSVRDIAEEARINVAMISYYFGSKEKLMQALFEHRTGDIVMRVESLLKDESLTPFNKVCMLIDEYLDRAIGRHEFYKILFYEQMIAKSTSLIDLINEIKKRNTSYIEVLIKDGQQKKAFKKDVDVVLMLNTMSGTVMQMMVNKRYYREVNNLQLLPEEEFEKQFRSRLSNHIKNLFKAILIYEA